MVVPLVIAQAIVASAAISSLYSAYSTQKTTEISDAQARYQEAFYNGSFSENSRFWSDYIRKHHLEGRQIKYPYRTGMNYNMSALYGAQNQLEYNKYARYGSYVNAGTRIASSAQGGYYMTRNFNSYVPASGHDFRTDVMYG